MSNYNKYKKHHINWSDVGVYINLSHEEFKRKYCELKNTRSETQETTLVSAYIYETTYSLKHEYDLFQLYLSENGRYVVYQTNWFDENKSTRDKHINSAKYINDEFKKQYNVSLREAYGYTPYQYKNCIPRELHFVNPVYLSTVDNVKRLYVSSIDACSQYPSNIRGRLPDFHTAVTVEGTVKPTEEYPFAFYINSGLLAEYDQYDTHDWLKHPLRNKLFYTNEAKQDSIRKHKYDADKIITLEQKLEYLEHPERDVTVLMRSSEYELTDVYTELYKKRQQDDETYKLVLNSSIGSFHTRKYECYKLAHIVAVVLGRSNNKMIKMIQDIGVLNVVQVCVDGVIYTGDTKHGGDVKQLGLFKQEVTGGRCIITGENQYIITYCENNEIKYKTRHAGYNVNKETGEKLDDNYTPSSITEVFSWVRVDPLQQLKETFTERERL